MLIPERCIEGIILPFIHVGVHLCRSWLFHLSSLQCALDTIYWTGFNHFVIWGSIVFYFSFTFVLYANAWEYTYMGTARNVMSTASFWFTMLLTVIVLLVPVIVLRFYMVDTHPTLSDKVRLRQRISKSKSKTADLTLRRSFSRRSTRSLRSGYAFSHQEGFGELITSGKNMRASFMDSRNEKKPGWQSAGRWPETAPPTEEKKTEAQNSNQLNASVKEIVVEESNTSFAQFEEHQRFTYIPWEGSHTQETANCDIDEICVF
jgi:hypothetical protein